MTGQRIESRPVASVGAAICAVVALLLIVWAVVEQTPHPAIAAIMPLAVAAAYYHTRPEPFAVDLTEQGLEVSDPPRHIPYSAIEGLTVSGKPTQGEAPLYVFYADGVVAVPARLTVPTHELFGFLASRVSQSGSRDVPTPLTEYLHRQAATFGDEMVYSFRARPHPTPYPRKRKVAVSLAGAATGVVWLAVGVAGGKDYFSWAVVGGILAFLFGLTALAFGVERRGPRIKNWRHAGLVIGPAGLALVQGGMRGELRWGELRNVEYRTKPRSFWFEGTGFRLENEAAYRGIHLVVEGARIVIADIYDRPLPLIYERIRTYWQGRHANV